MSDVADYRGRTQDVLAYAGAKSRGEALLQQELALPGQGGQICAGIQKLAQRFLLELLTEKGSMLYLPDRGTDFLTEARQGLFSSQLDVFMSFARAAVDLRINLQAEESSNDPEDERFDNAEALAVEFQPGMVKLRVQVTSLAGSHRVVILPINVALS